MKSDEPFKSEPLDPVRGVYELALRGKVYADVAPALKAELLRVADKGLRALLVDAQQLELIDSSGVNVFVHLLKRIRPEGGKVVFYGLNANVRRLFDIVKLDRVVGVAADRTEALGSVA